MDSQPQGVRFSIATPERRWRFLDALGRVGREWLGHRVVSWGQEDCDATGQVR